MGKKCKLSELCDVRDGTHDSPEYVQEGYPLVTSKNIVDGRLDLTVVNYISEKDYNHINERSKVDLGDIIMPMIGTIGNPHLIEAIPEFAIKNVALIKFPKSDVSNKFIYYFLQSDAFKTYVAKNNRGGTQKFLSLNDIRNMDIPALSYEKQLEICAVLDKVSELIDLRKEQLAKLDQLVKSRFIELMDSAELSEEVTVEQITEQVKVGFVGTCEKYYTDASGIPMLRTGNITDHGIDTSDLKYVTAEFHDKNRKSQIRSGDLLIARHGSNGQANVYDGPEAQCLNAVVIVPNQAVAKSVFLAGLINSPKVKEQIDRTLVGSTQHVVNTKSIANLVVRIPCLEVQVQYEAYVEQSNKSKLAIQQSLDKLELLKKSLMQEYFG